jgi:hypothetical protein
VAGTRRRWGLVADITIAASFIGLMLVQITRHQMWRDETNAWGLVLASHTLPELFHNLHYEGHPGLWHLLLWGASWVSPDPAAMKAEQAASAAGFILLIALKSPFSRVERILLLLNFYLVFEYAVVSRNYGIGVLLALAYAQLRVTRPDRSVLNATLLGLLANTNIYAALLSGALACEAMLDRLVESQWTVWRTIRRLAPAAAIYLAFIVFCAITIKPAVDISWRTTTYPLKHALDVDQLQHVLLAYLGVGLVPIIRSLYYASFANYTLLDLTLLPILWAAVVWMFWPDWRPLLIVGLTAAGAIVFGQLIYPGWIRHWGIVFLGFVVAYWLHRHWRPRRSCIAMVLLTLGAVCGLQEVANEATQPYSMAAQAAEWLRRHEPLDAVLIGTPDSSTAGVAVLLGQPMYFLDCSCTDTFVRFTRRRDAYRISQLPVRLATALQSIGAYPAILITAEPLSADMLTTIEALHISAQPVAAFSGAYISGEDFYLYEVAKRAASP